MATKPLPPPNFAAITLDLAASPATLVRMSDYASGEPHFSYSGGSRFDSPAALPTYGTCYLGVTLDVAFAEKVLHNEEPRDGEFLIASTKLESAWTYRFSSHDLRLADLTGPALKRLGGHAALTGTGNYAVSQPWGAAVQDHPTCFDGFIYMSRHHTSGVAVVVFDRAKHLLVQQSQQRLIDEPDFLTLMKRFHVMPC